jgi:cardiolipin synthase A/B
VSGIPVRQTQGVLVEVARAASSRLTLVSFAAYKTQAATEVLRDAAATGVDVRLILDGGTDAQVAFTSLGNTVRLFTWPPTLLLHDDPQHASLHAKTAIADGHTAFVTSANLTGHALNRNMELGLLVKSGPIPRLLDQHFDDLIATQVLTPWKP